MRTDSSKNILTFACITSIALSVHGFINYHVNTLMMDEPAHIGQILMFYEGDYQLIENLTTTPGYHLFVAAIAKLFLFEELPHLRLVSLIIALISVYAFFLCVKKTNPEVAIPRTFAYFTLPVLFPYQFLAYPHSLSMLCLLLGTYLFLNKRYLIAALMLGLGLLSRQTDIIWVLMFTTILFFKHFGSQFKFRNITKFFLLSWPFFVVISGFIVFLVWNKGIALGDTSSHQPGIYFENLFYFLFVNFILFLPIIIRNIKKTLAKATQSFQIKLRIKKINFGASIPIFVLVIALYLYFILRFEVWHHYNQNDYVLHNYLALLLYQNGWCRAGYFIALSLSVFLLFAIPFRQSIYLLTYAFGLALLLLHPMIEHRYYIPIFTLMLMFFKPLGKWPEWSQVFYFIALNVFVTYLCFEHGFVL